MSTRPADTRIPDLLAVPAARRDLAWLQRSLQVAVELELATIPPYLCGAWSCSDSSDIPLVIRAIARQEMLHVGLAANLLTTIGGTPAITAHVPTYPGPFPGGVPADLSLYLGGLTKRYIADVYLRIESPDAGPITPPPPPGPTLGRFYDAVAAAFTQVNPTITGERQLTAAIGSDQLFAIADTADVTRAIGIVKEQGEGTATAPDPTSFAGPAHYYQFAEMYHGAKLVQGDDGTWKFAGDPVPFPATFPMAQVPAGGWPHPAPKVAALLKRFDDAYTDMLDNLQSAWQNGDDAALNQAEIAMFDLAQPAGDLMQLPLPGRGGARGNYGPQFRYRR